MNINSIIAENLKTLRTERNLSLGQLAELSNISKVMLSQIEKGDTNPTINTLWKIANGLKVPYTLLLEQKEHDTCIIKKSTLEPQISEEGHYRAYCYYTNTPYRNFEIFQIELDEGCSYSSVGHSKKSEEYIMVLEGELTLKVNNETYKLNPNDSISFSASDKHIYYNNGNGTLKATITNFYPV
ncbi:XRE family transcriptional regulator [Clostridium botulinum]|uniref:helix-turn-helix domain-containing protein n=1 Tax=Clostridium botulinum TaxID=1491 RepID=UPI0004A55DB4|nr:XRE family transcriptional regulator [Clostridium botulinum]AUM98128.1 DNA-binding protein [Clostridium botulinum]AUN16743.1 DNA-binding protein [Clostridium botulinum]KEI98630.1 DNA-binding protein [Clostridium botulinum A2B3 87]MBY6796916.1 helix-turn-helix transcriptional regulator [Clostridium botulinum]MBY6866660.1 helix-turn-helix transcriptional regulator [Clostridium botulinum]